jgi:hypothetical protein
MNETSSLQAIKPAAIRYIKLGPGGAWFDRCVDEGLIEFGHSSIEHTLAQSGNWPAVQAQFLAEGRSLSKAKDFLREIEDFYTLGPNCMWVTIGHGRLWWAFADADVFPIVEAGRGARARRVIGRWRDTDVEGVVLSLSSLSTRLTKVAAYRQTICRIEAADYLLRRISCQDDPVAVNAKVARGHMISSAQAMIEALDWRDFEVMVDLIFASSGWRRISAIGGSDQADTDLILEQAVTGERAFIQVKSRASQAVVDDYVGRFRASQIFSLMFFVCHSPSSNLQAPDDPKIHLWMGNTLAEQTVRAGLFDWLIERVR